jgi:hypothetical protein
MKTVSIVLILIVACISCSESPRRLLGEPNEKFAYSLDFGDTHTNLSFTRRQIETTHAQLADIGVSSARRITLNRMERELVDSYLKLALVITDDASDRLSDRECKFLNALIEGEIERNVDSWQDPPTANTNGEKLATFHGWIYYKRSVADPYRKLLPGKCPQWYIPLREGEGNEWTNNFYVVLDLDNGYEGGDELWLASLQGHYLERIGHLPLRIDSVPVISSDGKHFAAIIRPLRVVDGDWYDVVCFERKAFASSGSEPSMLGEENLIYETSKGIIRSLRWVGDKVECELLDNSNLITSRVLLSGHKSE